MWMQHDEAAHFARTLDLKCKRFFFSEVDRTRKYSSLACPFSTFNVTRLFFMGFIKSRIMATFQRQEKIWRI